MLNHHVEKEDELVVRDHVGVRQFAPNVNHNNADLNNKDRVDRRAVVSVAVDQLAVSSSIRRVDKQHEVNVARLLKVKLLFHRHLLILKQLPNLLVNYNKLHCHHNSPTVMSLLAHTLILTIDQVCPLISPSLFKKT